MISFTLLVATEKARDNSINWKERMSSATRELDLLEMEKESSSDSQFQKFMQPQRSFRGIQGAISRINPQLLKNLIASGTASPSPEGKREEVEHLFPSPSTLTGNWTFLSTLPVLNPILRPTSEIPPERESAPLTIFYNGTVSVYDVPRDKAERIMKLAESETPDSKLVVSSSVDEPQLLGGPAGLSIARNKSLQKFMEKRKARLSSVWPYESVGSCGGREDEI